MVGELEPPPEGGPPTSAFTLYPLAPSPLLSPLHRHDLPRPALLDLPQPRLDLVAEDHVLPRLVTEGNEDVAGALGVIERAPEEVGEPEERLHPARLTF